MSKSLAVVAVVADIVVFSLLFGLPVAVVITVADILVSKRFAESRGLAFVR